MSNPRQVIALAGVGNLGKYVCEEMLANENFELIVLSRQVTCLTSGNIERIIDHVKKKQWLVERNINVQVTDYSTESVLTILNATSATTLLSFISCPYNTLQYFTLHTSLLEACTQSTTCKRFIPSEYIGNVEDFPLLPTFYDREAFRPLLKASTIEWTIFSPGWLMDYILPEDKTYMPPLCRGNPIFQKGWEAVVVGTGNELQSFTCARDVGKAVVELLSAPHWDPVTYVTGEWTTWNEVVKTLENFHGRPMTKSYQSLEEIESTLSGHTSGPVPEPVECAMINEWTISGAAACPRDITLAQRERFFNNVRFRDVLEVLTAAQKDFI